MPDAPSRRELLAAAGAAALVASLGAVEQAVRPNILWLSCEDMSPHLGCWGDPHAITPNLDRLAAEGVRYEAAFSCAGVCAPSRSGIITGCWPTSLGSHPMRSIARLPAEVRCFTAYLREAGYYCSNNVKTDYNFPVPDDAWDANSNQAHWRGREPGQPFFAVFNDTITHESQYRQRGAEWERRTAALTAAERQDPAALTTLPPYYPDTPEARTDWAHYYETITLMDRHVGARLRELEEDGLLEQTIIFFWSDHGVGLPRAKRWLLDSGTHVPLIIRRPDAVPINGWAGNGGVDSRLISLIDLGPTVLSLAGLPQPAAMHGQPFLGPAMARPREYVHGARDRMDERYDIVRAARDRQFRYVRNYQAWKPYHQHLSYAEVGPTLIDLRRLHAAGELAPAAEQWMGDQKPREELYNLYDDPHEQRNVVDEPRYAETLARLRRALRNWQLTTLDLGLLPESELETLTERYGSGYAILRQTETRGWLERLLEVVEVVERGEADELAALLEDPVPAVRAWAAVGLGNLAAGPAERLRDALDDPAACVRIAAARALCRLSQPGPALPVLAASLTAERRGERIEAATVLDEIGEQARPLLSEIRTAFEAKPDEYVTRLTEHTLRQLGELD